MHVGMCWIRGRLPSGAGWLRVHMFRLVMFWATGAESLGEGTVGTQEPVPAMEEIASVSPRELQRRWGCATKA
jgi:hypothetical protein